MCTDATYGIFFQYPVGVRFLTVDQGVDINARYGWDGSLSRTSCCLLDGRRAVHFALSDY